MYTVANLPGEWSERFDPMYAFVQLGPHLVDRARSARKMAVSYRGFKVGAAALAMSKNGGVGIFDAANYKPSERGEKVCAERAVINQIRAHNFDKVVALVVSGPLQPDKHSGLELPTLHPCGDCRQMLTSDSLISDETLIMPVHPLQDTYELYSRQELNIIHASADSEDAPEEFMDYTDPSFRVWERGKINFSRLRVADQNVSPVIQLPLHQLARLAVTGQI